MSAHADTSSASENKSVFPAPQTFILQPITHEVYSVPQTALIYDAKNPVFMEYDVFEQMGATGQISGERLLHHDRANGRTFDANQVLAVRLKQRSKNGPPLYAWASRMATLVPGLSELPENVATSLIGHEFLWLWPPSKAHNAYHMRRETLRTHPDMLPFPIDKIEPTCRYAQFLPGAMLGPDDIEGTEHVPYHELTAEQRFFCMCIKPQQTLFPRRPTADRWTERVSAIIDHNQRAARRGGKWTLHNAVQTMRQRVKEDGNQANGVLANKRKRDGENAISLYNHHRRGLKSARIGVPTNSNDSNNKAETFDMSAVEDLLTITEPRWMKRIIEAPRPQLWAKLPHEILVRILCTRLSDGLTSPDVADARRTVLCLRSVSRGACALVDSYVGVQLASLSTAAGGCVIDPLGYGQRTDSVVAVAARMRALGLGMTDVAQLERHEIELEYVTGWTLPKTPAVVPDWRWYLELRREAKMRHGNKTTVLRVPGDKPPSAKLGELLSKHRHDEPHIWASRALFENHGLTGEYDTMLRAAGECDLRLRDEMHALAGVGG